jgi:tetratricopeptide (TPR) repeat protein
VKPPAYDEAIRHLSAALVQRPEGGVFHLNLGYCYAKLGSYDLAIAEYRRDLALSPSSLTTYVWMADALAMKKDIDGALAAYRDAIRLEPQYGFGSCLKMGRC